MVLMLFVEQGKFGAWKNRVFRCSQAILQDIIMVLMSLTALMCLSSQKWLSSSPCYWPVWTAAVTLGSTCSSRGTSSTRGRTASSAAVVGTWPCPRAVVAESARTTSAARPRAPSRPRAASGAWRTPPAPAARLSDWHERILTLDGAKCHQIGTHRKNSWHFKVNRSFWT